MEKKVQELICIGCPMGCRLSVEREDKEILSVKGNTCPRGEAYARKELTNPTRILTTIVPVINGVLPVVSVKTEADIPKGKIKEAMDYIKGLQIEAPVKLGEVLVEDLCETGVALVATKTVEKDH